MNIDEIKRKVCEINDFVSNKAWFDFDFVGYGNGELLVSGSLDTTAIYEIKITFRNIYFSSILSEWSVDNSVPHLEFVDGDRAVSLNQKYSVDRGYFCFKFNPKDYDGDHFCLIFAQEIDFTIGVFPVSG